MNPNHDIKCWPEQFAALASGEKNFEYRKNDRGYQVGDVLLVREWNPADHDYTGQTLTRVVGHILREGFGLPCGYAVLGLKPVTPPPQDPARVYPQDLTDDLRNILSMMMWTTGPIAHALRDGGQDIKRKAEEEQAEVMHWLIGLALEHGSEWRAKASDRIRAIRDALAAASEGSTDEH